MQRAAATYTHAYNLCRKGALIIVSHGPLHQWRMLNFQMFVRCASFRIARPVHSSYRGQVRSRSVHMCDEQHHSDSAVVIRVSLAPAGRCETSADVCSRFQRNTHTHTHCRAIVLASSVSSIDGDEIARPAAQAHFSLTVAFVHLLCIPLFYKSGLRIRRHLQTAMILQPLPQQVAHRRSVTQRARWKHFPAWLHLAKAPCVAGTHTYPCNSAK